MSGSLGPTRPAPVVRISDSRVLLHPNPSTPQARRSPEQRRWQFVGALDRLARDFSAGELPYNIVAQLFDIANQFTPEGQADAIAELRSLADGHPISRIIRQCPLTRHAQRRPRGYPGDPGLFDFIYRHSAAQAAVMRAGAVGQGLLLHNLDTPFSGAVRARRTIIANRIAAVAGTVTSARVLSVACGYARELDMVPDMALERLGVFVGVDGDAASLEVAGQYKAGDGHVAPLRATVPELLKNRDLGGFDLIVVPGLYDNLKHSACRQMTKNLFRRLNQGGRLLVGNILPGHYSYGYMELFMHWSLFHRDTEQISDFARGIAAADVAKQDVFMEPNRCIGFVELTRA